MAFQGFTDPLTSMLRATEGKEASALPDLSPEHPGLDALLGGGDTVKVASMEDLFDIFGIDKSAFLSGGNDEEVTFKSAGDLWKVDKDASGGLVIKRLFNPEATVVG